MPKAKKRISAAAVAPFPTRLAQRIQIACDGAPDPEIEGVHVVRLLLRGRLGGAEVRELTDWMLGLLRANTPTEMWNAKRGAQQWKTPKPGAPVGAPSSRVPVV